MANMQKYYKELADNATDVNDRNMYEKQARKHALKSLKARRETLSTQAYKERRLKEKARQEAEKASDKDNQDDKEESKDSVDTVLDTKPKKKKTSKKKTSKKKTSNKE